MAYALPRQHVAEVIVLGSDRDLGMIVKHAAEQRRPLRSLLADSLRAELEKGRAQRRGKKKLRWVTSRGGLPPVDISDRAKMHEWLRAQR